MCREVACSEVEVSLTRVASVRIWTYDHILYIHISGTFSEVVMYQALYRKWRPASFDSVYGQEHITTVLKNQVESGRISHAYLFCGTRGTGKTTCAKILAKAANCLSPVDGSPCGICEACRAIDSGSATDVLEIDAASNNGVDNIRALRDEVLYPPSSLKKRVYIIDEVHMLSDGAFNALLKTLEEPPEYVVFILATTEFNKIPPTILSRCQRFEFRRIDAEVIGERLKEVTESENIKIDIEALRLIARLADGALRDALSLLESCAAASEGKEITYADAEKRLGVANNEAVIKLFEAALKNNTAEAVSILNELYKGARDLSTLVEQLIFLTRDLLLLLNIRGLDLQKLQSSFCFTNESFEKIKALLPLCTRERLLFYSGVLSDTQSKMTRYALNKKLMAEVALIKLCELDLDDSATALAARISALERGLPIKGSHVELRTEQSTPNASTAEKAEQSTAVITEDDDDEVPWFTDGEEKEALTKEKASGVPAEIPTEAQPSPKPEASNSASNSKKTSVGLAGGEEPFEARAELLEGIKADMSTFSFAYKAEYSVKDDKLFITTDSFTRMMLERDSSKKVITEALKACSDKPYVIVFRDNKVDTKQTSFFDEL